MTNNVLNWRYDRLGSRASICGANDGWGGGAINWKFAEKMYQNDGDGPRRKATFLTPDEFLYDSKLCGWETDFDADGNEMSLADKKKDPKRGIKSTEGLFAHGVYMEVKNIESPNDRNMTISDTHNSASFRIARLGEAYLLYAEACLETGNLDEGKKYLNAIQKRAEAPETELTTQTLRDEKQYELGSRLVVFTTSFVGALLKSVRMLSLIRFRNCMTTSSSKVHHTMEKNIIYVLS